MAGNETEPGAPGTPAPLNLLAHLLADALAREAGDKVQIVRDEARQWLAIEEVTSGIAFAEAEGDELRIVPFKATVDLTGDLPYAIQVRPSWLDGSDELVARLSTLADPTYQAQVLDHLRSALDHWSAASNPTAGTPEQSTPLSVEPPSGDAGAPLVELLAEPTTVTDEPSNGAEPTVIAQIRAVDISSAWSWASAHAGIPQILGVTVSVAEPLESARLTATLRDADIEFGATSVDLGGLPAGVTLIPKLLVPLSARVMSRVDETFPAECVIQLEDVTTGAVLGRLVESVDVQPRNHWLFRGDRRRGTSKSPLAKALLAAFVRPNHPEVAALAREAADVLGRSTGDPSFHAFQLPPDAAVRKVEDSISAIFDAARERRIAYSAPPPAWDYRNKGQRIRDHGEVAQGGLGTCMDTTVLLAAVIEHVRLAPVLVLIPGHIFVGYWTRDPSKSGTDQEPDWYPRSPLVTDVSRIRNLVDGGYLGLIETTKITAPGTASPADARTEAIRVRLPIGVAANDVCLIDVAAARREGIIPLPAVNERPDGTAEIYEYRPDASPVRTEVDHAPLDPIERQRRVDTHPPRYRTWKASLFSLNATNDLLNLKSNARVQQLVLPADGLGVLEDRLNQDVTFSLHSAWHVPETWAARGDNNAEILLGRGNPDDHRELLNQLQDRRIYVQRWARSGGQPTPVLPATSIREIRAMAQFAKTAKEERGMNPLYLCLGLLNWEYKAGVVAAAPLILVPVNIAISRGRQDFSLSLDAAQNTTPNAALIEWLRRELGITVPGLVEPLADRAGIDVDAVISDVRNALLEHQPPFQVHVTAEARLATLDLSAFRMWQDLNQHADSFLQRPLIRHLVETPTETFTDPIVETTDGEAGTSIEDELESLETPIPADSTQKRAVLWARQGRTFVLQGPPGTGKSQTITNMVAECVLAGLRVLFVAEKGTALAVVQRRLDDIGLGPFTLNLHHEGSNATEVRAQLKRALTATVSPDAAGMEAARRRLRNARFELTQYPQQLHEPNAAELSAYSAHDELLVVGDGPTMPVSTTAVAHHADQIAALRELFQDLQRWTGTAGVRPDHPWRLAGTGNADPFDVEAISVALRGVLAGLAWSSTTTGPLRDALEAITHPTQYDALAAAANPVLPAGAELAGVLQPTWPTTAKEIVDGCEQSVEGWRPKLHGFDPQVLDLDLRSIATQIKAANESGFMGRKNRQAAAIEPLVRVAPMGLELTPDNAPAIVADLIAVQDTAGQVRAALASVAGLATTVSSNPFQLGALTPVRSRLDELLTATGGLRRSTEWAQQVQSLGEGGLLTEHVQQLTALAGSWRAFWDGLAVHEADFQAWRSGVALAEAVRRHHDDWNREVEYERLVALQRWCTLVRKLEPLRNVGLDEARVQLLEGTLPASTAEEALLRGVARASLDERVNAAGLDRFDAVAHDLRVSSYSEAQHETRQQWVTFGPAQLLARRGGRVGSRIGGLDRELQKTSRKLGTRPILRKYGDAVQELTPLVLCSPSSVVDLIEPGVMEFDLVIFDEASQITVPEAVGALGRAKAAIVVGDTKQMPPTRSIGGGPLDDEEIDDPDIEEIVEDQESILSECELARVPTLSLNWHYRSQDEQLIAFSNRAYYRGELSSFPTPTLSSTETGVEFRRVDGQYLRAGSKSIELTSGIVAGSNTNSVEAEAIVAFVHELVHQGTKLPSIGIVTFNEQQRQLIEDLLYKSPDRKIADVLDESKMGRGEVLFVKALEQVQGDERDVIIFSIAFSKQANGKIPTNFGPLSNSGGERRLNVAITRARRKNIVFCSFEPGELDVSGSTFDGPKHLKEFLTFARNAGRFDGAGDPAQRAAVRDRHRDDIASALRDTGLHVRSDVGLSNFRLDLVLARADNPDRPILPVLLDGESWRQRTTVSDRDVLPVEVLEGLMGWPKVARIWWPMWLQNRDEVLRRVLEEVDEAERRLDGETAAAADDLSGSPTDHDPALIASAEGAPGSTNVAPLLPVDSTVPPAAPTLESPPAKPSAVEQPSPTEAVLPAIESPTPFVPTKAPLPGPTGPVEATAGVPAPKAELPDIGAVSVFRPAHSNVVGARAVLDALPDRAAAAAVREQLLDVIEAEGPVELSRLTRLVARRFGLNAVRASRADDIARLVSRDHLRKSMLGSFAWPTYLDPETWRGHRTVDPNSTRTLDEVAPEEIANAMSVVKARAPEADHEVILRTTAGVFGIVRLGPNVRTRLEGVLAMLSVDTPVEPSPIDPGAGERPTLLEHKVPALPTIEPQPMDATTPTVAPRQLDPVVEQLARQADELTRNLTSVDESVYYEEQNRRLPSELRSMANEIALDWECEGNADHPAALQRLARLSAEDGRMVRLVASQVWYSSVYPALEPLAQQLALRLAEDPDFDPLPWGEWLSAFVTERLDGHRPALIWITRQALFANAENSGLIRRNEAQVKHAAEDALSRMSPLERDTYGFTSRNARRQQLAEDYLRAIRSTRHGLFVYWMSRFESEQTGALREARYATASRRLAALGENRATISRLLGISTSVLDRIERENRSDVELAADDPILTHLAPALGQ